MSKDKEIIQKLIKIAENQQKIIAKLAQDMGAGAAGSAEQLGGSTSSWEDVVDSVGALLAKLPMAKGYGVNSAQVGTSSGSLRGKLIMPKGGANFKEVTEALKAALAGKTIMADSGKTVTVSSDKADISFIGMT